MHALKGHVYIVSEGQRATAITQLSATPPDYH